MKKNLTYEQLEAKVTLLEKKLKQSDRLINTSVKDYHFLQTLGNTIPTPIYFKDAQGIYRSCNDSFADIIFGVSKDQIMNHSLFDLAQYIPAELAPGYYAKDQYLFENPGKQVYQASVNCADGLVRIYVFHKATVHDKKNNVVGIVGVMLDVTELENQKLALQEKSQQLEVHSETDPLTGLHNRRKFNDIFANNLSIAKRQTRLLNFAIIDVDNFKNYNDTYGHVAGDNALILLSRFLQKRLLRADDYIFRLGGEEFGLLFYSDDEVSAREFANNIRQGVESLAIDHIQNENHELLTISLGIVTIKHKTKSISTIYEQADNLMYRAKNSGRNRILSLVI
ncbi:diguanylate cyclase with PAS/PAC sensor [Psychromonas ingrahamii 37]|uniref:diguanylate cyclase n=1 Tax=Psychromonas ingrahamii (strain DSM 17664 / CCUG 51855 / 37) TaxID=357804 RepID=A1SX17_PSYIN|nr:GGDEF domain-containing protein [Psychromonas ingrahamii]ABM04032.1 diguanylate cyclase with PAS/PAC sensor [Psychromonas ingrahamii 37]